MHALANERNILASLDALHDRAPDARRHHVGDLFRARLEIFRHLQDLAGGHFRIDAYALEAALARLEIGDTGDVLIGHPERKAARRFFQRMRVARIVKRAGDLHKLAQAFEIKVGIGAILKIL